MNHFIVSDLAGKRVLLLANAAFEQMFIRELLDQVDIHVMLPQPEGSAKENYDAILADFTHLPDVDLSQLFLHRKPIVAIGGAPDGLNVAALIDKPIEPERFYETLSRVFFGPEKKEGGKQVDARHEQAAEGATPVDFREGIMRLGGNQQAYLRVLKLFLENQAKAPEEILLALGNNDLETAARAAHTVKGVAGNVGAKSVYEAALPLEQALKRRDLDEARVLLKRMEKRLDRARQAIAEYLSAQATKIGATVSESRCLNGEKEQPRWDNVQGLLEQLLHATELRRPVECETVMTQLMPIAWPSELMTQFERISDEVACYRYPAASDAIAQLRTMIGKMEL